MCISINSLMSAKNNNRFRDVILKIYCEFFITMKCIPMDLINNKSKLVQVMVWCHAAPSHYLNQCWLRSMKPYSISRAQWVNHVGMMYSKFHNLEEIKSNLQLQMHISCSIHLIFMKHTWRPGLQRTRPFLCFPSTPLAENNNLC